MALLGLRNPLFVSLSKVGGLTLMNSAALSLLRAMPVGSLIPSVLRDSDVE